MSFIIVACYGRADKSTWLKLWWFCLAECGFEAQSWHLCPWARHFTIFAVSFGWDAFLCISQPRHVLWNAQKWTHSTYWKEKGFTSVFLVWLAAYFLTAPRKELVSFFKNKASQYIAGRYWMLLRLERHSVTVMSVYKKSLLLLWLLINANKKCCSSSGFCRCVQENHGHWPHGDELQHHGPDWRTTPVLKHRVALKISTFNSWS